MVKAMIEKKDPAQKIVEDESSEDDPIIELTNEVTKKPEDDRKPAPPTFGQDDNGIDMQADIEFEREEGQEIIPLAQLDEDDIETDDNVIEITEFDRHFPNDDDEASEHASLLDPSDLDDKDFIELFDIEEEGSMQDEEIKELSESEEKAVEAELSRFFDDALEDETGIENNTPPPDDKFSEQDTGLDLSMTAAALSSGAAKIGRPASHFPQDAIGKKEATSLPKDQSGMNKPVQADLPASDSGSSPVVSPEQIDRAIERIINEKLAGRIEHIIYEIIEKAVKKEIERLKASLLGDSTPDKNR